MNVLNLKCKTPERVKYKMKTFLNVLNIKYKIPERVKYKMLNMFFKLKLFIKRVFVNKPLFTLIH